MNENRENGYLATIQKGIRAVGGFRGGVTAETFFRKETLEKLKTAWDRADAVVIGAGAGLSTSAGFTYSGERFERYFFDFKAAFGISELYSGGFYPFPDAETFWAWWARHIYFNRYIDPPRPVYRALLDRVKDKDYFVVTTNVDHQFQRAGFEKKRLFYTQGDYGLFQSRDPRIRRTFDNEAWVRKAMKAQGFQLDETGVFRVPEDKKILMRIPREGIPRCPEGGDEAVMNLRSDDRFVEDAGWHAAAARYAAFLKKYEKGRVLYLELGVGSNTPVIIKYPFWAMTAENPEAVYVCVNFSEAYCPDKIADRSLLLKGDVGEILEEWAR